MAYRLVRMFSLVGDTVLDLFMGTATTSVAAARCARNAFGVEIEASYIDYAIQRLERRTSSLFGDQPELVISDAAHKARKCG